MVAVTYDIVTPESAEDGTAAASDYAVSPEPMRFREALETLTEYGPYHHDDGENFYASDAQIDYRTGESTHYAVHLAGSAKDIARLVAAFRSRKVKYAR
jgi:hypothetical protein